MAQFTNQAQLSYNNAVVNSNVAVGQLLEVLSVTKNALNSSYTPGDSAAFVVSLVNSGTIPYTGLTLTDNLGAYTADANTYYPLTYSDGTVRYYINGVLQATPTVTAGPPLTVTGITVPAGGNATVIYETTVNSFATPETAGTIENEVTLSGGGLTPITASETITASSAPNLTITKSINPVPVAENGQLTYTFLIQNTGNTAADEDDLVTLTDDFDPILSDITVTYNGTAWAEENYTYNEATGEFASVPGRITVPAATYVQAPNGSWTATPGTALITITGTV